MKILLLGWPVFQRELQDLGHEVLSAGPGDYDLVVPEQEYDIVSILAALGNWQPDVCLFIEHIGWRVFPERLAETPCPLVFYSIDTHLNLFWLKHFATACDAVITTQRDYLPLIEPVAPAFWLPWSFDPEEFRDHGLVRDLPVTFVGTVDEARPRRRNMLELVARSFELHLFAATPERRYGEQEVAGIFSRSAIVLNEAVAGEVNFRVFEAMATGALLLTERVENGLLELFEDRRHLVTFAPEELAGLLDHYLRHPEEREAIALAGREEVLRRHTRRVRAPELEKILLGVSKRENRSHLRLGRSYSLLLRRGALRNQGGIKFVANQILSEAAFAGENIDTAELLVSFGHSELGLQLYSCLWEKGERSLSLVLQWGLAVLFQSNMDEARHVLSVLPAFVEDAGEGADLERALAGDFPSAELFAVLARLAERGEDPFTAGFASFIENVLPLSGIDIADEGLRLFPQSALLHELKGNIYLREKLWWPAATAFCHAVNFGSSDAELLRKAALALEHSFCPAESAECVLAADAASNSGVSSKVESQ